jgi:predicted secreted protein
VAPQDKEKVQEPEQQRPAQTPKINWDDTQMKNSYANVCNAVGTREEVVLFFGLSNPSQTGDAEVTVQISQRVILSPYAAKRLANMLDNVVKQYESRWGPLGDIGTTVPPATEATN